MPLLPITSVRLPSTLAGYSNGKLPSSALTSIGVGNAVMEVTAARAFKAMFASARAELGVVIREVGDYRSFNAQMALFLSRYKPASYSQYRVTSSSHRKYWASAAKYGHGSKYWIKKDTRYATAATPGTSNHGYGLALDIAEEYDSDSAADPISSRFVDWLARNAFTFGISAELQSEVWHWRYFAGDHIPPAVLEYERQEPPPPTDKEFKVNVTREEVKQGDSGVMVKRLQSTLFFIWIIDASPIDGQFGPKTAAAVKRAQTHLGLKADGICGIKTWEALENSTP